MSKRLARYFGSLCLVAALASTMVPSSIAGATVASKKVSTDSYVHSFCTAFSTFRQDFATAQATVGQTGPGLVEGRKALVAFFGLTAKAVSRTVDRLHLAGTPNTKDGDKIASVFVAAFTDFHDALTRAQKSAKTLSVNDKAAFKKGADSLLATFKNASARVTASLRNAKKKYGHAQLDAAVASDPACTDLKAS